MKPEMSQADWTKWLKEFRSKINQAWQESDAATELLKDLPVKVYHAGQADAYKHVLELLTEMGAP